MELDHMLNGRGSRQRHQELIRETQRYKLTREVKPTQPTNKAISPLRAILIALINIIMR